MYDLHLHLDGSVSSEFVLSQAKKDSIVLPTTKKEELLSLLQVSPNCTSLNEYLEKFQLPLSLLQTEDALENCIYDLISRLSSLSLSGAEIRFAPQLHMQKSLPMEAVIEATLSGMERGKKENSFHVGLILCCMRTNQEVKENYEKNIQTVELSKQYQNHGVLALDLAGAEALYGTDLYEPIFQKASSLNIPFTIHAGEAAGPNSIWKALNFGAQRIGHGVHCVEDDSLVNYLLKKQIPLEICPSSNLQTKAVPSLKDHPILKLLDMGLCVTLNTDNMTVSNTTLFKEYDLLSKELHMTPTQKETLIQNARKASFL